jgi:uroporphyrinogen decarboxylase
MKELGMDGAFYQYSTGLTPLNAEWARDKYGRLFRLSGHGMPMIAQGPIEEVSDVRGYDMASKLRLDDLANIEYLMNLMDQDGMVILDVNDPFQESWLLRGSMESYLLDYFERPGLVHDLGRIVTDYAVRVIDLAAELGIEAVIVGGDLAGETTTLISPAHYREFVRPYQQELVDHAHRRGMMIIKHTDGNAWPILDDLVEIGFDGFNPVQPQCMDIGEVKDHLAGRMSIIGNIDCRHLLPAGTPEEVEATVKETIAVAAPGGGYVLASSNSLHPDCKPENIVAMVQAAHKYGVYP